MVLYLRMQNAICCTTHPTFFRPGASAVVIQIHSLYFPRVLSDTVDVCTPMHDVPEGILRWIAKCQHDRDQHT